MTSAGLALVPPARRALGVGVYWRVSGVALAALAALGFLLVAVGRAGLLGGFLAFDTAHNLLHAALAAVALALGFGAPRRLLARNAARAFGAAYALLGVAGLLSPGLFGAGDAAGLRTEVGEGLLHLFLGAWGLYAGFGE